MKAVIPMLVCRDAAAEMDFCRRAFAAVEVSRRGAADGSVIHAALKVGAAMIKIRGESSHLASRAPRRTGRRRRSFTSTARAWMR